MTNEGKCAVFLLIVISKKTFVIRGNSTPNYKEAQNERNDIVDKAEIKRLYLSAQRSVVDVFKTTGYLLYQG